MFESVCLYAKKLLGLKLRLYLKQNEKIVKTCFNITIKTSQSFITVFLKDKIFIYLTCNDKVTFSYN